MSRTALAIWGILSCLALTIPLVGAHAPDFPGSNESLNDAQGIPDPTKSWAIYAELHTGGEAQYYLLSLTEGDNVSVMLTVPREDADRGFIPSVALMGPGVQDQGALPDYVERPNGAGARVVEGARPAKMTYEPFSPSAFYELATTSVEANVSGDYYLAVFDDRMGGHYGLAVGQRESFTVGEWLLIPFDRLAIYQWEGQPWWLVLAPAAVTFLIGFVVTYAASRRRLFGVSVLWSLATVAGLLMAASGISLLYQMLWSFSQTGSDPALVVTVVFAIIPLALGSWALWIADNERTMGGVRPRTRIALLVIGGIGLLTWAGWVIGPLLVILAAVLPGGLLMRRSARM